MSQVWLMLRRLISPADGASLRSRVIQSGLSVLAGDVYANVLRLVANLLLTRLLYPEAFGLMLIVNLVVGALQLLSDVGVRGAIITRQSELDDQFIDTAWTLMIIRGLILGVIGLIACYPISLHYDQPQLVGMIALASAMPLLISLQTPYAVVQEKKVKLGRIVVWRALGQTTALGVTIVWLLIYPTIWALVANGLISAALNSATSYYFFPARRPRLCWNKAAAWEIFRFGRWVFVATALSFFARNGNGLVVSHWVATDILGVFSIALSLAALVEGVIGNLSWTLLHPVYAELSSGSAERFSSSTRKIKLATFTMLMPPIFLFALFGREIIEFLYDPRYHDAGWMLQIIVVGHVFYAIGAGLESIPQSFGNSYTHMWLQFARGVTLIGSMMVGGLLGGTIGLMIGISASHALYYPILRIVMYRYGVHDNLTDLALILGMLALIVGGWSVFGWPAYESLT